MKCCDEDLRRMVPNPLVRAAVMVAYPILWGARYLALWRLDKREGTDLRHY